MDLRRLLANWPVFRQLTGADRSGRGAGAAYLAAGLCTRFGVYDAGVASTRDPWHVVIPQCTGRTGGSRDGHGTLL